jgi:hypothetical protein
MVLTASFIALRQLRHPQITIGDVTRADFYLIDHLYLISVPLTLSLWMMLLASSKGPHIAFHHRKKTSNWGTRIRRMSQMFGFAVLLCSCSLAQSSPTPGATHGTDEELIQTLRTKLDEDTATGKFSGVALITKDGAPSG